MSERRRRIVWVVLPVYDEAEHLERLLDRIDEALAEAAIPYRAILVDDGSRDETPAIIERARARLPLVALRHERNQGLGAAIRDGLAQAARSAEDRDILVTMDADDTHTPGLIRRMVRMVEEGHDVVIASRYRPDSQTVGVPGYRRLLSRAASLLFRTMFPIRGVRDYTCGFRAYRAGVIREVLDEHGEGFFDQDGFQCMVDILLKLRGRGLIFGEVPFVLRYDQKAGGTKMQIGATIGRTLLLAARKRIGR
jgi:dolichol-phosphate mannosyltransferase